MNGLNLAYQTNVNIVNNRLVAFGIDYFILSGIIGIASIIDSSIQFEMYTTFLLIFSTIYFIIFETLFGCTIGKFIMGVRIIDKECNKPNLTKSLVRSSLRVLTVLVPITTIAWFIEYFVVDSSKYKQRMFDMMAGTLVVYKKDLKRFKENTTDNSMSSEEFLMEYYTPRIAVSEDVCGNIIVDKQEIIFEYVNDMERKLIGIEGLSVEYIMSEVNRGAKFVKFMQCVSFLVGTRAAETDTFFIKSGEKSIKYHKVFTLRTIFLGWWHIPKGIINTIICLIINFTGGKNMTQDVVRALNLAVKNKQNIQW